MHVDLSKNSDETHAKIGEKDELLMVNWSTEGEGKSAAIVEPLAVGRSRQISTVVASRHIAF